MIISLSEHINELDKQNQNQAISLLRNDFPLIMKLIWNRNERDDQEELSSRVLKQMNEVSSLLSKALNIHLNVEQQFTLNTSDVFMSIGTLKIESLLGKEIPSVSEARFRLPSTWNLSLLEHQRGSLKVRSSFCLLEVI